MLINKILLWKLFSTETNSRHTVQILKSFIFMHYGMQQILLNFVFMHNTAVQKFQFFVFMGIVQLHAKMTCIHAQFHEKFWLKFRIRAKFRAKKKLFISNECAILCKTGFVLIRKWCGISCKKSHFVQNHETVAQENRLFCGNLSF